MSQEPRACKVTSYTYSIKDEKLLQECLDANKGDLISTLSTFLDFHPCSADELINLWGYKARRILKEREVGK